MAPLTSGDELTTAWRALAAEPSGNGWKTISIAAKAGYRLLAGRRSPGNEESLLIGFPADQLPPTDQFPKGRGFVVELADLVPQDDQGVLLALSRTPDGSRALFTLMAEDVMSTVVSLGSADRSQACIAFLARIRAWQEFMRRGSDAVLGPEAEVGLFGELSFLSDLLAAGLTPEHTVTAWVGPLGGNQDFLLGTGAIEVKSTLSQAAFTAKIVSLDQLDESRASPLFLAAVRLRLDRGGLTLPALADTIRSSLSHEPAMQSAFEHRLVSAGLFEPSRASYVRRLSRVDTTLRHIGVDFPRLVRANVPAAITAASYDLNLPAVDVPVVALSTALHQLGAIHQWN